MNTKLTQWIRFENALAGLEGMLGCRAMRHMIQAYALDQVMQTPTLGTITPQGDHIVVKVEHEELAVEAGYLNAETSEKFDVHSGPYERPEDKALILHYWQTAFRLFDELEVAKPETQAMLAESDRRLMYQAPPEANQVSLEEYIEYFIGKIAQFRPVVSRQWLYELAVERAGWKHSAPGTGKNVWANAKVTIMPEGESTQVSEYFGYDTGPTRTWGTHWHTDGTITWALEGAKVNISSLKASFKGRLNEAAWAFKEVRLPYNAIDWDFEKSPHAQIEVLVWDELSPRKLYEVLKDLKTVGGWVLPAPLQDRAVADAFVAEHLKPVPAHNGQALRTTFGLLPIDGSPVSSSPLTWLREEHGEDLFSAHYGLENWDFLRALRSVKVATAMIRNNFQVVHLTRGDWEAVKLVPPGQDEFPMQGVTVTWGENGYNLSPRPWLAALFRVHGNSLVRRLIDGAKWEVQLEESWPEELKFRYMRNEWEVSGWPVAVDDTKYVQVWMDEIRPHWSYLGAEAGPWDGSHSRNSQGESFLKAGAKAYAAVAAVLLPLQEGETKNFVIACRYTWCGDGRTAIFGFSATRTTDGLTFAGYDPGVRYSSFGWWGREIAAVEPEAVN